MIAKFLLVVLWATLKVSFGLKLVPEESSSQAKCAVIHPDPSINMTWLRSVDFWYIHAINKNDLYESLHYLMTEEEFQNLTEEQVKNSCITMTRIEPGVAVRMYGFNKTFFEFEASFPKYRKGVIDWAVLEPAAHHAATDYIVSTDNKTYFMAIEIFDDGGKGYYVASPFPAITPEERQKINKAVEIHNLDAFFPLNVNCENDEFTKNIKLTLTKT